jgi:hypothetical protein
VWSAARAPRSASHVRLDQCGLGGQPIAAAAVRGAPPCCLLSLANPACCLTLLAPVTRDLRPVTDI